MIKKMVAVSALTASLFGCASIVSDSQYTVALNSSPDNAQFVVTNKSGQKVHSGRTPSSIVLKASSGFFQGESYAIEIEKEGFQAKSYALTSTVDGWYFGNILLGGWLGMLIVDPATGAMFKLPERVDVSLDESVAQNADADLTIATIDSLSAEQRASLVPVQ